MIVHAGGGADREEREREREEDSQAENTEPDHYVFLIFCIINQMAYCLLNIHIYCKGR